MDCRDDRDCSNNGAHICVLDQCGCPRHLTGDTCTTPCPLPCEHGGVCQIVNDDHAGILVDYKCDCRPGYIGRLCSAEEDTTTPTPRNMIVATAPGIALAVLVIATLVVRLGLYLSLIHI